MATTSDVYQLNVVYAGGAQYMECVLHFLSSLASSPAPDSDAVALGLAFRAAVETSLLGCWNGDISLLGYKAHRINNGGGPTMVIPAPAGTVGTAGLFHGMATSRQAALIENDYYDTNGTPPTWRQGRIFLGGVPGDFWNEDVWTSTAIAAYQLFMTALKATIGTAPTFTNGTWSAKYSTIWAGGDLELSGRMGHIKRRTAPSL
jgi:hypothetical protein